MKHVSVKLDTPVEFVNITSINPLISKCHIKVCYVQDEKNRNRTVITKEFARDVLAQTLPGSPIVGTFNKSTQDFEEHNKQFVIEDGKLVVTDDTRPYGFVDLGAKVWFQKFLDDGKDEREYLMTEGYLWTGQYPEAQRVLEFGNNQSMELEKDSVKGFWAKDQNEKPEFFIINDAIISKLCILGEEEEPCFEGAHITNVQFSFEDSFQQQLFSMMKEIKEILSEGGASMNLEEKDMLEVVEEEVIEETVVEETVVVEEEETVIEETLEFAEEKEEEEKKCPECGKPLDECECEEEPKAEHSYSLEEIPEYVDLLARYSDLEVRHQEALDEIESLKTENGELVTFKLAAERKDKVAMVDSFYMLSDEDKKDVLDNIDQYSIDDIEAKLSIICVRNKVSFDLAEDKTETKEGPTTYNLNSVEMEEEIVPAWVKAARAVANETK